MDMLALFEKLAQTTHYNKKAVDELKELIKSKSTLLEKTCNHTFSALPDLLEDLCLT